MNVVKKQVSLHPLEVGYLRGEIESQNNDRTKRALQHLCKLIRSGCRVGPAEVNALESAILGALVRGSSDEKVRRWSLSGISLFGRERSCLDAVKYILSSRFDEPQVMSAAIAALYKLSPAKATEYLNAVEGLDPKISFLSALQVVPQNKLREAVIPINIEESDSLILKLSLLLVGMNKSPENLFHPTYCNEELVQELWLNGDDMVAQYSAWAAAENPNLTSKSIKIDLSEIEGRSDNQRSYIYRLYASEAEVSSAQTEVIMLGRSDLDAEARMGCAIGIRDTWFEGIEEITKEWYFQEENEENRLYILDHVVRQSNRSSFYHGWAMELYEGFESDKAKLDRMMAHSYSLPIYTDFQKANYNRETGSLFPTESMIMTKEVNNYNISNSSFSGQNVIGGGDAKNSGTQTNEISQDNRTIVTATLEEAIKSLESLPISPEIRDGATRDLRAAQAEPTAGRITKAAETLQVCEQALGSVAGMAEKAKVLGGYAATLWQFLPS